MIVGIDLGTTNSLIAIYNEGKTKVIPNALGKLLTPSVVSIDNHDILTGEAALNRLVTHPECTISNFKRYMGSDKSYKLNNHTFRPEELSALILKRLKEDAEDFLGTPVTEAVISVPAYFSDAQRKATKIAGQLAGLKVERLINEPTAAGIAYGLFDQEDEVNYLIFDIGGGTFDVSILSMFSGIIEVRASCGDNFLGGTDFTNVLEKMLINHIKQKSNLNEKDIPLNIKHKIHELTELAKHQLSIQSESTINLNWDNNLYTHTITKEAFEKDAEALLNRLHDPVKKALNDSKLAPSEIQKIILVGGASRMSVVKKLVSRMFGKLPLCHIDPDTVVVQGCAIQAGLKANNSALNEIVVTDVCPYSLGVAIYNETMPGRPGISHFDPVIERNTVIPVSRSRIYAPCDRNQKLLDIKIYQGENFFLEKNIHLGTIELELPSILKNPAIEVRFTYDINGLLEVEAIIQETGEKKSIVIVGNPGVMNETEISEKLKALEKLKIHPREETENRVVLSQAERLYVDLQGEKRDYLANLIKNFIQTLDRQDKNPIIKCRKELEEILSNLKQELNIF